MKRLATVGLAFALTSPAPATPIAGLCFFDCDNTLDGLVGINDLLQLLSEWGTVGASCDPCFVSVGINDFLSLLRAWGPCPPLPDGCAAGGDGETCLSAIAMTTGTVLGTTADNTPSGAISCCLDGTLIDEWYCFVAPETGTLVLSTCNPGTDFDARLTGQYRCAAFEQCGSALPCRRGSVLTRPMWSGETLLVRVAAEGGAVGHFEMTAEFTPVPEVCDAGEGDCCEANGTPACDHPLCCAIVCEMDPFCCEDTWDAICADEAFFSCTNCF